MARTSFCIIADNEASKIEAALKCVTLAEALVLADSISTHKTVEVARRYTDRFLQFRVEGFVTVRSDARLTGDWNFPLCPDGAQIGVTRP